MDAPRIIVLSTSKNAAAAGSGSGSGFGCVAAAAAASPALTWSSSLPRCQNRRIRPSLINARVPAVLPRLIAIVVTDTPAAPFARPPAGTSADRFAGPSADRFAGAFAGASGGGHQALAQQRAEARIG